MKKRIACLIALLMILCLALSGCGQRDNETGAIETDTELSGNSATMELGETTEPNISDVNNGGAAAHVFGYDDSRIIDGKYEFMVGEYQFLLRTNIWDYIVKEDGAYVFKAYKLAQDLGWKSASRNPESVDESRLCRFVLASEEDVTKAERYVYIFSDNIDFNFMPTQGNAIEFDRLDKYSDADDTLFVNIHNSSDNVDINIEMAIVSCYLLENIDENTSENPLKAIVPNGIHHIYR